jgi:CHAT domain-containing protein
VRLATALTGIGLAAGVQAQQLPVERLRVLVGRDDGPAILQAVREYPDDSRELVRQLLVEAHVKRAPHADSALVLARRLASAYAATWEDSFPLAQVARFSRMTPERRAAKLGADSVRRAGNAALGRAGVDAALALWREALRRSAVIADSAGIAAALGNIGAGLYRASELDSASIYLDRAHELAEAIGDRRTAANAIGTLASVAKDRGELRRAQVLYTRALDLRSRIGDVRGTAADHNNLGLLSAELDELDEARAHYEAALSLARRHRLEEPAAAALLNLGNAASVEGEYAEAARRYRDALAIYRSSRSDADAALVLHNLGLLALRRGDYATARARLLEALAIFARSGTVADMALIRSDLSSVAAATGDLRGALTHLRRAEQLLVRAPPEPELAAGIALARADLAAQLNSYAQAERQYARAEALYRRAGSSAGQAEAQQGRALLSVERRQYTRALELLRAAARTQAAFGDRRPAALTNLMIGHAQHRQGDLAGARRTLEQATDSLRSLGDVVGEAAAMSALGDLELEAGAPLVAEALYRQGLVQLRTRSAATVSWQLRAGLGRALHARGALAEASAELRSAIGDVERAAATLTLAERRATFLADKWDVYAQLALVERARGDAAAALAASERMRARQMLDLLARGRVAPRVATDSSLAEREQDLRRRIAELTQRLEEEEGVASAMRGPGFAGSAESASGVTREALARAQEQYAQLLLELLEEESAFAPIVRGEVASWREVARRLSAGEALVEYLVSDSTTMVFVVTPDTLRIVDLNVGRRALESLVDFVRGTLVRPRSSPSRPASPPAWRAPLRRLHQHLLAPVEAAGALTGVRRLIVVPHVELNYLPFAALIRRGDPRGSERDEFLIERYEIGYAPSASVWVRLGERVRPQADTRPRTYGVLALAPRTSALPGSREEVEAIRALYGNQATVLTNGAASEAAFRAAAPRYDVVHLATYGVLNKHNPLFSYVSLNPGAAEDGRLEVHEVFGLALDARLLVLSACQTALGSGAVSDVPAGDDWVGLVRAFLGAGAANVIATLWPVEDRSTASLMARVHRGLRAGDSEIAALAVAQRTALRNKATVDPFYWAGFVLVGGR